MTLQVCVDDGPRWPPGQAPPIIGPQEAMCHWSLTPNGVKARRIVSERRVVSPVLEGHLRRIGFRAVGPDIIYRWIANRPTSCLSLRTAVSHYRHHASSLLDF